MIEIEIRAPGSTLHGSNERRVEQKHEQKQNKKNANKHGTKIVQKSWTVCAWFPVALEHSYEKIRP